MLIKSDVIIPNHFGRLITKHFREEVSCEEEEDDQSYVEHYKHLGVMNYIYGCEIDKDDVITDAMALYASSFCDMFDNPKTIMVKEFRGRNLFSIKIDKYDTIRAKYVKKEIANRLQFLGKTERFFYLYHWRWLLAEWTWRQWPCLWWCWVALEASWWC